MHQFFGLWIGKVEPDLEKVKELPNNSFIPSGWNFIPMFQQLYRSERGLKTQKN